MKSTITATVKRIDKSSISLSDVYINGEWISYSHVIRTNPKKLQAKITQGDRIRFEAKLTTFSRRQFDGDTWDLITCYRISNPSNFEILNPNTSPEVSRK